LGAGNNGFKAQPDHFSAFPAPVDLSARATADWPGNQLDPAAGKGDGGAFGDTDRPTDNQARKPGSSKPTTLSSAARKKLSSILDRENHVSRCLANQL
jgi:hypothetical protein